MRSVAYVSGRNSRESIDDYLTRLTKRDHLITSLIGSCGRAVPTEKALRERIVGESNDVTSTELAIGAVPPA